jgi:hypothetical protein
LARGFHRRGFDVEFIRFEDVQTGLQAPAIAGTRIEGRGHFIAILSITHGVAEIGDPMVGPERVPLKDLAGVRDFTGFLLRVIPKAKRSAPVGGP